MSAKDRLQKHRESMERSGETLDESLHLHTYTNMKKKNKNGKIRKMKKPDLKNLKSGFKIDFQICKSI